MTNTHSRRVSRFSFYAFVIIAAALAVAAFLAIREVRRGAEFARQEERDKRIVTAFRARLESGMRAALRRVEGAELLVGANPPSTRIAARALTFVMKKGDDGAVPAAAIVLDQRGGVIASRRRGGVPRLGKMEGNLWLRAVAAMRRRTSAGDFHIEAGVLGETAALFLAAPSPSAKGYWGVILPAEELLRIGGDELGPREAVFLLSGPDQNVLYARRGGKFLHEAVGRGFDKSLSLLLGILACCDSADFNTVHEGDRAMSQLELPGGTRKLRLVRVADRRASAAAANEGLPALAAGVTAGWLILVGGFAFLRGGEGGGPVRTRPSAERREPGDFSDAGAVSVFYRVSEAVARGAHFRKVVTLAAQEAARHLGADRSFAALFDEEMDQLFEVYSSRLGDNYRAAVALGTKELPEWISIREGDVVEVTSVQEWEEAPAALRSEAVEAVAVFPMMAGKRPLGLMSFYFETERELAGEQLDFCTVLALQAAEAVSRSLSLKEPPPEG